MGRGDLGVEHAVANCSQTVSPMLPPGEHLNATVVDYDRQRLCCPSASSLQVRCYCSTASVGVVGVHGDGSAADVLGRGRRGVERQ